MCHPGFLPPADDTANSWKYSWENELKALTSEETQSFVKTESIRISSFREIINK